MEKLSYIDPAVLQRMANLQLKARTVVEGVLTGLHKSPHHGSSVEFAEHKEYSPGDELKHIDWKIFAKSDKYYVKQFEEETNLKCYLLLDLSASMGYRSEGPTKAELAAQLATTIAYLCLRQQDAAGLVLFSRKTDAYVPPRSKSVHLQDLLHAMSKATCAGETDLAVVLGQLSEIARRRSLIVVLSDFFDWNPAAIGRLKQHRARGHDVAVFHVLDPAEVTFPFDDNTLFVDMEGSAQIEANPKTVRAAYLQEMQAFCDGLRRSCLEADIDYYRVETNAPVEKAVADFVGKRARGGSSRAFSLRGGR